jgi:hypothetical protein
MQYSFAAVRWLHFVVFMYVMLFPIKNLLYPYIRPSEMHAHCPLSCVMYVVPLISYFHSTLHGYFSSDFDMVPIFPVTFVVYIPHGLSYYLLLLSLSLVTGLFLLVLLLKQR